MSESSSSPAGPFSFYSSQASPPPPEAIRRDDYAAADQARQRLQKRGLFSSVSLPLPHLHRYKSKSQKRDASPSPSEIGELDRPAPRGTDTQDLVDLSEDPNHLSDSEEGCDKDVYRWAILYENQRGATVFSTAYYSPLTLLPLDPPPFTIPTAVRSPRRNQPTVSLEDYPLPDGSWKWVSRAWMIDMRGDGQVQYDGFEYSRSFRSKKWGPNPGFMSNRGLVRRRRWLRLMMRPAMAHPDATSTFSAPAALSTLPEFDHHEEGATRPPSVMLTVSDESLSDGEVWRGDSGDWGRCHFALRRLGRDGRKLELWARWLGISRGESLPRPSSWNPTMSPKDVLPLPPTEGKSAKAFSNEVVSTDTGQKEVDQLAADTCVSIGKAPKEDIAAVLRTHGSDILDLFIYPDSRARFLSLLGRAGLLPEIRAGWGASDSVQVLDFWSYTQDLATSVTA